MATLGFAAHGVAESSSATTNAFTIHLPAVLRGSVLPSAPVATETPDADASPTFAASATPDNILRRVSQVGGTGLSVAAGDGLAYVGHGPRMAVYRLMEGPGLLRIGESPPFDGVVTGLAVDAGHVYAAATADGLWVIDVTDPTHPRPVGHSPARDGSLAVVVRDGFAYVAEGDSGLRVVDVADPALPAEAEVVDVRATVTGVALAPSGERLYVIGNDGTEHPCCEDLGHLWVFDLSDPAHPTALGHLRTWEAWGLAATSDTVYLDTGFDLLIVDVTDARHPVVAAKLEDTNALPFAVRDDVLFALGGPGGLTLYDVAHRTKPVLLAELPDVAGNAAVLDTQSVFVAGWAQVRMVDVHSPSAPTTLYEAPLLYAGGQIHDLGDGLAYVDDDPVAVADLRDPSRPALTRLSSTTWPWGRILDVDGRTVVARSSNYRPDVVLVDASDPAQPHELSRFDVPYDPQVARLVGERLYVNGGGGSGASILQVLGVAELERPELLGQLSIGWVASDMAIMDGRAYVALEARTGDTSADSPGGLQVLDVKDPDDIDVVSELQFAHSAQGVALEARWGRVFAYVVTGSRYRVGGSGLYIVDATDPARPSIEGFEPARGPATDVVVHGDRIVVSVWDAGDRHNWPWIVRKPSGHAMVFDPRAYPALDQLLPSGSFSWGPNAWASIDGTLWAATAEGGLLAWR